MDFGGPKGWTPLHSSARWGRPETTKMLLANGATPDAKDHRGWTPLHEAADGGHTRVVETLIAGGANVNATDPCGRTPLHMADGVNGPHAGVIATLLWHGAKSGFEDEYRWAPFRAMSDETAEKVAEELLRARGIEKPSPVRKRGERPRKAPRPARGSDG